jgi:hypothetical protein
MMAERERPYLKGNEGSIRWDWWGENPAEIVLVIFILVLFFFIYSLPSQGWGIDDNPAAAQPEAVQPPAGATAEG